MTTMMHEGRRALPRIAGAAILVVASLLGGCAGHPDNHYASAFLSQGLNDTMVRQIERGMTHEEVLRLLGPPLQRIRFDNLKATAWDYRYVDTWGYFVDYAVMIGDDGRVVNTVSARIMADNL